MIHYNGPLEPGTYAVPVWGDEGVNWPLGVVDVPAGYFSPGGWVVDAGMDGIETDDYGSLSFWHADEIVNDPCAASSSGTSAVGPTVEDLVGALMSQGGQRLSEPETVTIGGHQGLHLTVKLPKGTDGISCDYTQYALWTWGEERFALETEATIHHLWVLDVDGQRIIMAVSLYPDQKRGQNAEILEMAEGASFIQPTA
jgi:hypothetical protein